MQRSDPTLLELWRYPVKSMLGEQLEQAELGPLGVEGDRQRAVVDAESGVSLSAKRYRELLGCRAWTTDGEVMIQLPDGSEFPVDSSRAAELLSRLLNRRVFIRRAGAARTVRHEFPKDATQGEGEPFIWEPGLEAFFDSSPLHLITTATLKAFARLQPESVFACARFRPNFLVASDEIGFIENDWVGRDLQLGAVKCHVSDHTARCVMTTRPQGDLPEDRDVIRAVLQANAGNVGVALRALDTGTLHPGDRVGPL